MIKNRTTLALLAGIAALGAAAATLSPGAPAQAQNDARTASPAKEPVLIELFTSQGCSSCPPADKVAAKMATSSGVVVISRPVTYWDRLGWKDTLAKEANTNLQQAYARRGLEGQNGVYTPQAVVNGRFGTVGSRELDVRRGVAHNSGAGNAAIRVNDLGAEGYGVGLGGDTAKRAELVLVAITRDVEVAIGSGENGGRTVTYTNVLRDEQTLASWTGGKASHVVTPAQLKVKGANRYALVLREPGGGPVLAARWLN
ncbi:MAG: DUF1223 domain-containing protein [Rhizobiales bacterium]|nr:DUF1223 domain-containing protein [Hyphomicrobiales bacterium]